MNEQKPQILSKNTAGKPFFSIIIPVYNAAQYLRECLECIVLQDFTDWETVIVDDGSTDSSLTIAEEFRRKDPRFRIFSMEKNSGGAYTPRLTAARLAQADYIVTIDADDIVSPDLLRKHFQSIATHNSDLVIPEMWRMERDRNYKILPLTSIDTSCVWNGRELVWYTLVDWQIPMCGFAIRRGIYLEADSHVTDEDRKSIFSDELLSRWILPLCPTTSMTDARYYYRQNEESVTNINLPRYIDSRMRTCDSLTALTSTVYGTESPTHIRALEDKLYSAVGLLRLINKSRLDRVDKENAERRIAEAMRGLDMNALKGKTSPRYLALMRIPVPVARRALMILDPILRK